MYIELHTSSAFSFLDGASLPGTLIERAAELDYPALALLDRDGLYGAPQFYRAAKAAGLKDLIGTTFARSSYRSGKRSRRSSTVWSPTRSRSAARRGPTPLTNCRGVERKSVDTKRQGKGQRAEGRGKGKKTKDKRRNLFPRPLASVPVPFP